MVNEETERRSNNNKTKRGKKTGRRRGRRRKSVEGRSRRNALNDISLDLSAPLPLSSPCHLRVQNAKSPRRTRIFAYTGPTCMLFCTKGDSIRCMLLDIAKQMQDMGGRLSPMFGDVQMGGARDAPAAPPASHGSSSPLPLAFSLLLFLPSLSLHLLNPPLSPPPSLLLYPSPPHPFLSLPCSPLPPYPASRP